MKRVCVLLFLLTLGLLLAACNKMPQENIPLPEGETMQMEPITKVQWEALRIEDGQWASVYCMRKKWGEWEEYPESVAYRFSLPDAVEYYSRIHNGREGVDGGGELTRANYKWRFDAESSSVVITTSEKWDESYTVLDAGADSFYLLRNVKDGDLLSSVSWILYKFVRVDKIAM